MTDEQPDPEQEAMRALLKRSFEPDPADAEPPDLLRGVQRKIRERSRGKFFGDGWSTSQSHVSHALVALLMLLVVVAIYLALGPMGLGGG